MPKILKLAVAQNRTLSTTSETLNALSATTQDAATQSVDLILFPEAYVGGYPRTCDFGGTVGGRTASGRDQFLHYFHDAVDLGDTPTGAGEDWVERRLPIGKGKKHRGDGTREYLEKLARDTGVFIVTGLIEKCGGSLYCACVYVCPKEGVLGKRRKVMPTGSERLIWAQGSPSTLKAVTTTIKGVDLILAAAICWENYMPLLRQSLYSQNVNLYLAPTADFRDTWLPLMQTVAFEGRTVVLSANQCMTRKNLPKWIHDPSKKGADSAAKKPLANGSSETTSPSAARRASTVVKTEDSHEIKLPASIPNPENGDGTNDLAASWASEATDNAVSESSEIPPKKQASGRRLSSIATTFENHEVVLPAVEDASDSNQPPPTTDAPNQDEFVSRGGSCIVDPIRSTLAGPLWDVEDGGLLVAEADFEDCERGRLDLDVAGSYSRNDAFKLSVQGLDINPPP